MKKYGPILGLFLIACLHTTGQADSVLQMNVAKKLIGPIVDFAADNLGNVYLLTGNNQLKKINSNGDSVAVYNDVKRYGKVSSIDATNPLKVLVYYKDFSAIVVLDRLLNVRNTIDLRKQQMYQVNAITTSYDNNIWLYDEQNSKLKKIDETGKVLLESSDFRQVFEKLPTPQLLFDRDGQLYMYDSARGLLVFDYYGGLKNNLALQNVKDLLVIDKNNITCRDSLHLLIIKLPVFETYRFTALEKLDSYSKIRFTGNMIYALNGDGSLEIYSLK